LVIGAWSTLAARRAATDDVARGVVTVATAAFFTALRVAGAAISVFLGTIED